jgi:hypothetical protein
MRVGERKWLKNLKKIKHYLSASNKTQDFIEYLLNIMRAINQITLNQLASPVMQHCWYITLHAVQLINRTTTGKTRTQANAQIAVFKLEIKWNKERELPVAINTYSTLFNVN